VFTSSTHARKSASSTMSNPYTCVPDDDETKLNVPLMCPECSLVRW
jgi:hypothetical protein